MQFPEGLENTPFTWCILIKISKQVWTWGTCQDCNTWGCLIFNREAALAAARSGRAGRGHRRGRVVQGPDDILLVHLQGGVPLADDVVVRVSVGVPL